MKVAIRPIITVLAIPKYALLTAASAVLVLSVLIWFFNFDTLLYVVGLPNYAIGDKSSFFLSAYTNSILYFFRDPVVFTRVIFSLLAGVTIALYFFIRQHQQTTVERKGFSGLVVALLASGCVACGTSILSPLLSGVGAAAAATLGEVIGTLGNLLGIILMLFAINGFSKRITYVLATQSLKKGGLE